MAQKAVGIKLCEDSGHRAVWGRGFSVAESSPVCEYALHLTLSNEEREGGGRGRKGEREGGEGRGGDGGKERGREGSFFFF